MDLGSSPYEELTIEKRRSIRIRLRFKSLVRTVIANLYWLTAEEKLRNTVLKISQKRRGRYLLSIKEKAILRMAPEYRTEEDIHVLMKVIGYLKCFRKYSEDLKYSLVAHTHYEYYPPNRVLVRQNRKSLAMYFIISGHLEILVTKYVPQIEQETIIGRSYFNEGDGFGDSSLLHDTPRTATVRTLSHCELLVLKKEDFDRILRSQTLQRTMELEKAIHFIPQFAKADQFQCRDLCIVSQIIQFSKNDVILGEGIGRKSHVHFIINGVCKIIEHVPVKMVKTKTGAFKEVYYTLKEEEEYNKALIIAGLPQKKSNSGIVLKSISQVNKSSKFKPPSAEGSSTKVNRISKNVRKSMVTRFSKSIANLKSLTNMRSFGNVRSLGNIKSLGNFRSVPNMKSIANVKTINEMYKSRIMQKSKITMQSYAVIDSEMDLLGGKGSAESYASNDIQKITMRNIVGLKKQTPGVYKYDVAKYPDNVKIRFMEVCTMIPKASFNMGEYFSRRRVIAATDVTCMIVPSTWLLQQSNVWKAVREFLNRSIPDSESIFKIYRQEKEWDKFKKGYVKNLLAHKKIRACNEIHNVPYSIRIKEDFAFRDNN